MPPQLAATRPTGVFRSAFRRAPKYQAKAEKSAALCGLLTLQAPRTSWAGSAAATRSTVKRRNCGSAAPFRASSAPSLNFNAYSMFDWPLPSQSSPANTSLKRRASLPSTANSKGPPAAGAGKTTDQRPSASAMARPLSAPKLTVTAWPGWSSPQTRKTFPACTTMWSPKMAGIQKWVTAAAPKGALSRQTARAKVRILAPVIGD